MATLLRVPEVAAGATEVVLSKWLVNENVPFAAGEPIAVVVTERASVELEAPADAMILRALVPGGCGVAVGSPMAVIGDESERDADADRLLLELGVVRRGATSHGSLPDHGRLFSGPLARRDLRHAGLTADQVHGSGPNRRIGRRDVERAVARARMAAATPSPAAGGPAPAGESAGAGSAGAVYREIPHTRLRRAVAKRLTASMQSVPHLSLKRTARIDRLLALREQLNAVSFHRISVNDLVIRAVAVAYLSVPDANVIWTDAAMRRFESVDVAVAVASGRGLVAPVLRGVERTSPSAIANQVKAYARQADDGTLRQRDLEGGSITVANLGRYGVEEFTAIIDPPHSAVLAVGAGRAVPVVVDAAVQVATQMALVLSVDHRAIDGALAAQWMDALIRALEEPLRLVA